MHAKLGQFLTYFVIKFPLKPSRFAQAFKSNTHLETSQILIGQIYSGTDHISGYAVGVIMQVSSNIVQCT